MGINFKVVLKMDFNKGKEHSFVMKEVGPIQESGNKVK
jgi:hypothetical protein